MKYFAGFIVGLFIAVAFYNNSESKTRCNVIGQPEQMEVIYIPDIENFNYKEYKLMLDSKDSIK